MSFGEFPVNDAMAVKTWSKYLVVAERENLEIAPLIGKDENSIIQEKGLDGPGDKVTCGLVAQLQGDGFTEGETAEGSGESLSIYDDSILINELGHLVGAPSKHSIDQQRVPFNIRDTAKGAMGRWWAKRKSISFFNQVCGYTPQSDTKLTGLNAVVAPTRHIWAAAASNDQGLTSSDTFTLDLIDEAVEKARVGEHKIMPVMVDGQERYVMYLHDYQVTSLRTNASSGEWRDIQQSALAGGQISNNPLFTGAIGEYNGVILRRSQDVTQGVNSSSGAAVSTVRRAVLLGAQSAAIGFGKNMTSGSRYRWSEKLLDHDRKLEVAAISLWGLKKCQFNSTDHGVVVVSTYAAAAS